MKNALFALVSVALITCCHAYVESTRKIVVRKDGTGDIMVRVLFNPKNLEKEKKPHDAEALKKVAYGKGVEYVISTEIKGKNGWVGYLAKYKFKDITEVKIFPASLPRAYKTAIISEEESIYRAGWKFEISGGGNADGLDDEFIDTEGGDEKKEEPKPEPEPVGEEVKEGEEGEDGGEAEPGAFTLTIIPLFLEFDEEEGDEFEDEEPDAPDRPELKALQKGRRYVTYIQFEGDVNTKTSTLPTNHYSKIKKNTIVLNDEQFYVMWTSSAARARISEDEPDFAAYVGNPSKVQGYRAVVEEAKVVLK